MTTPEPEPEEGRESKPDEFLSELARDMGYGRALSKDRADERDRITPPLLVFLAALLLLTLAGLVLAVLSLAF
ncbi:MAG: hypothetical protein M3355_02380 [Actinomycetota bacterium]|nr:hypothetical protein [Actinomycetota bacterium]